MQRNILKNRRGGVAILSAFMLPPLVTGVGMLVDYVRWLDAKQYLQSAVDNAALAGAVVYNSSTMQAAAQTAATNAFKNAVNTVPFGSQLRLDTGMPSASPGVTNRAGSAYNVVVSATLTMTNTFSAVVSSTTTMHARARASNPIVMFNFNSQYFGTGAADWDAVYIYAVPTDNNGRLDFTKVPTPSQLLTAGDEIGSNCDPGSTEPCIGQQGAIVPANVPALDITATTVFGFAFMNQTGGRFMTYTNPYGSSTGQQNWFYSSLLGASLPPSYYTDYFRQQDGYPAGSTYSQAGTSATQTDCSLQVWLLPAGTPIDGVNNPPANTNSCVDPHASSTGSTYTTFTCAQLSGKELVFWWNDMGGIMNNQGKWGKDNYNWNDIYYVVTCSAPNGLPKVFLSE